MPTENKCPQCGKPVLPDALMGLCPDCMLKAGLGSGATSIPGDAPDAATVPPTPAELARFFPQLEILELLGRGGMGAVYKARQKQLDRVVALKILPPGIGHDAAFAERFVREAKALAKLNHPNIVTLYEFGRTDGLFYFLMEFVDGVSLRQLLNAGRIAPREALAIVPQICDALQYAHDHSIVHRDIKPENILLDRAGRVKVADFGLAKLVGGDAPETTATGIVVPVSPATTEAGQVIGTPQYMAPEQVQQPQEVDHRADIYSLGVVFYQMLTGELPARRIEPPSRKVRIDVRLDEVVLRALEKEPGRRYQQASVLKTEVETIAGSSNQPSARAQSEPDKTPLAYVALSLAGLSGILGITAFCYFPQPPAALVLSVLVVALSGVTLGIRARKTRTGKQAVVVGSINLAIWLVMALVVNSTAFKIQVRELAHLKQWPGRVIAQTIQHEVGRQLREAGATYDDLQVSVAILRDSATPFKVSYRGLQNFKGADGTTPGTNGEFIMKYIGSGQWQGALAGTQFTVTVGSQDNIDLPFVNDPQVVGDWESVDFVVHASDFNPDKPNPAGNKLFLKGLTFLENGKMPQPWMTWTKGVVIHHGDKTASHYEIREINGKLYMLFEWKSGDYTISGMKPYYYVLKKTSSAGALSPATNALTFGPVIERVLNDPDDDAHGNFIIFESGKPIDMPVPWNKNAVSESLLSALNALGHSVDALSDASGDSLTVFQSVTVPIDNVEFDTITPAALATNSVLNGQEPGDKTITTTNPPSTFLFKTYAGNRGSRGILQIVGFTDNPRGVKIRYKLAQSAGKSGRIN
ncbi:MAG: serine/threonine-protein kinase [Verrucomicrobiia bacterium]|jgi:serine/threonine protein kinase